MLRQCGPAGVAGSGCCARSGQRVEESGDPELPRCIGEEHTRHPFCGTRRMRACLRTQGFRVSRKRVQRLMRRPGPAGMAPGPNTGRRHPQHAVRPYLPRGVEAVRPNRVWSSDITCIRLERGFACPSAGSGHRLAAVIDWYSRKVPSFRISNTPDAGFCAECLQEALRTHGTPEVFNSGQGVQYTGEAFTGALKGHEVKISMDGRGRAPDNIPSTGSGHRFVERLRRTVKYEDVYLKGYASLPELERGMTECFAFYNCGRLHRAPGGRPPNAVYATASGGGARIQG